VIQFAYPWALWSLLAIPLLAALYLLRPRRRRVVVATIALWQAARRERESAHGFLRLLRNLSLLLLLAAALALGLAVGGPQWLTRSSELTDTVLVLDVSASMQTRAGLATTRFEQALAEATGIVDGLPRDGRMLVMTSGRKAVLRTGFESDRGVLRRVLGELRPSDEAGRPREALALALSLLRGREQGRVYFLTDGAFDPDVDPGSPQVVIRAVGTPARNAAITRFDFRQEPGSEDRFQVLLSVRNYTDAPVTVPASASLDGRELFRVSVELAARAERTLVLPFPGRALGQAMARIEVDDDLAADNQAFAALSAQDSLRVLLFTRGNLFLESVLAALPNVALSKHDGPLLQDLAPLARTHDIVVFDGIEPPRLPPGSFLLVDSVAPGLPFADAGRVARPGALVSGSSALMRDVDLSAVRIDEARRVTVQGSGAGLQRLIWSRETALGLALLDDGLKVVYLGFDLARSNFPLQAAFPLFVSQSLAWLRPRGDGPVSTHVPAGASHSIALPATQPQVVVRMPSGHDETVPAKDGVARIDATGAAGIYRYAVEGAARQFAVSAADARESDIARRWLPRDSGKQDQTAAAGTQALLPLWPYLLALALLLLALEWGVWIGSRRSA
jgi:Ca-activated chloride channel homolog